MRAAARAAMDEPEDVGRRAKRLKTENPISDCITPSSESWNSKVVDHPPTERNQTLDINISQDTRQASAGTKVIELEKQHRPMKTSQFSGASRLVKSKICSTSPQHLPISDVEETLLAQPQLIDEETDFSHTPSDPIELANWVCQVIGRIHNGVQASVNTGNGLNEKKRRSSSYTPDSPMPQNGHEGEPVVMSELEMKRNEGRLRKQRWRSEHREQNEDNDLRCRINSRAKALYGVNPSAEKTKFMETEFVKRKARRDSKGSREASRPNFTFDLKPARMLFSGQVPEHSKEVNAAGLLLLNTLQGVRSNVYGQSNLEAATALNSALRDDKLDAKSFVEALHILSADEGVMDATSLIMKDYEQAIRADSAITTNSNTAVTSPTYGISRRASAVAESPSSFLPPSGLRGGAANGHPVDNHYQSSEAIKALNAATLILSDIAEGSSGHYVTPYGNPPPLNGGVANGVTNSGPNTNGGQIMESIEPHSSDQANPTEPNLTKSQIDALLALANGGSLMDNHDDDSIQDDATVAGDLETSPQPDSDVNATLQRIITELTANESGGRDQLGFPLATSQADKAATLQRLFVEAGISINTILPAAQAHATSQLYAHLSSRAYKFPTSGGINPAHASTFGTTAQMTQRMLARPVNIAPPLQAAPSPSRGNVVGQPARGTRGRSSEEVRKIREYGFPPLPGSRPGIKKER